MKNQCSEKKISGRKYYDLILLQKNAKNDVLKFFFFYECTCSLLLSTPDDTAHLCSDHNLLNLYFFMTELHWFSCIFLKTQWFYCRKP